MGSRSICEIHFTGVHDPPFIGGPICDSCHINSSVRIVWRHSAFGADTSSPVLLDPDPRGLGRICRPSTKRSALEDPLFGHLALILKLQVRNSWLGPLPSSAHFSSPPDPAALNSPHNGRAHDFWSHQPPETSPLPFAVFGTPLPLAASRRGVPRILAATPPGLGCNWHAATRLDIIPVIPGPRKPSRADLDNTLLVCRTIPKSTPKTSCNDVHPSNQSLNPNARPHLGSVGCRQDSPAEALEPAFDLEDVLAREEKSGGATKTSKGCISTKPLARSQTNGGPADKSRQQSSVP